VTRGRYPLIATAVSVGVIAVSSTGAVAAPRVGHTVAARPKATVIATLKAPHPIKGDQFGTALANSGDHLVVSAPRRTVGVNSYIGAAFVFTRDKKGAWGHAVQLSYPISPLASQYPDTVSAVAISGNTVVIGDQYADIKGSPEGAVYLYEMPKSGWKNMTHPTAILSASNGFSEDYLGLTVSISGTNVVSGSPFTGVKGVGQGAAYVWSEPKKGWKSMTQTAELTASNGAAEDAFGASVGISQNEILVGAPGHTVGTTTFAGEAYVYVEPKAGWKNMTETRALEPKVPVQDGVFGDFGAVAIIGTTVAVGAPHEAQEYSPPDGPGAVYVFSEPKAGWGTKTSPPISQIATLTAKTPTTDAVFGLTVAISTNIISVGEPTTGEGAKPLPGENDLFAKPKNGWKNATPNLVVTAPGAQKYSGFGVGALSQSTLLVGAPDINSEKGDATVYQLSGLGLPKS
jgi:FG-GAP repeat